MGITPELHWSGEEEIEITIAQIMAILKQEADYLEGV